MCTQDRQQQAAGVMSDKLKQGLMVISDDCFYSRIAIENILSDISPQNNIYSFECITDYKKRERVDNTVPDNFRITLNISPSPLYGEDVPRFPGYEKRRAERESGHSKRHILLLTQTNRHATGQNAILTHDLQHASGQAQLTLLADLWQAFRQSLMTVFRQYISGKLPSHCIHSAPPCCPGRGWHTGMTGLFIAR